MARLAPVAVTQALAPGYRSIYILPTRFGLWFAAVLLVMLVASINYGSGLAYGLTFFLTGLALVAMVHTHRNLVGLRLRPPSCEPVFAGERATFVFSIDNHATVPRLGIELEYARTASAAVDVPAQAAQTIAITLPARTRGRLAAPAVRLCTRFPLSLWRAWSKSLRFPLSCLVYPTPAPVTALPPSWELAGETGAVTTAPGEDFHGLREYRPGDPPRRLAWKALAAGRGLLSKQFGGGAPTVLWLDWDGLPAQDTEQRLQVLTRGVLEAERSHRCYGLRLPGVEVAPAMGPAHAQRCLEHLALYRL